MTNILHDAIMVPQVHILSWNRSDFILEELLHSDSKI